MNRSEKLIDELYDTIGKPGFSDLPQLVASVTGARSCTFQVVGRDRSPLVVETSYFPPEMDLHYVEHEIFRDDVWLAASRSAPLGSAVEMARNVADERYLHSQFYQDMIRRFGDDTGQCIAILFPAPEGEMVSLGLHRAFKQEAFDQASIGALNGIAPHLRRIIGAQLQVRQSQSISKTWEATMDAMRQAALLVSQDGLVVLANRPARAIVRRDDGFTVTNNRIQLTLGSECESFARCLYEALQRTGERGGALLVSRRLAIRPYAVSVQPVEAGETTYALVLVTDPDVEPETHETLLRSLYGLTRAEAEVALLVAAGLAIDEVADRRRVTAATAKTLLQRAYQKTDVSRASELARLVARLPA